MSGLWYRSAGTAACVEGVGVQPVHRLALEQRLNGRPHTEQLTDSTMLLSFSAHGLYARAYRCRSMHPRVDRGEHGMALSAL
jgi:hypothetical protein